MMIFRKAGKMFGHRSYFLEECISSSFRVKEEGSRVSNLQEVENCLLGLPACCVYLCKLLYRNLYLQQTVFFHSAVVTSLENL
jgi:hypothetical protein